MAPGNDSLTGICGIHGIKGEHARISVRADEGMVPATARETTMITYRIETTKGDHTGTLREIAAWQAEYQGAMATLVCPDGSTVDVDGIEFDVDDLVPAIEAMARAGCLASARRQGWDGDDEDYEYTREDEEWIAAAMREESAR